MGFYAASVIAFIIAGISALGVFVFAIAAIWSDYPLQGQLGGTSFILVIVTLLCAGIGAALLDANG